MKLKSVLVLSAISTCVTHAAVIVNTLPANNQATLQADAGQTFTTSTLGGENALATIEIEGPQTNVGADLGPFTLELYTDADGDHLTWGTGSLLGISDAQSMVAGGQTISTFSFSTLPVLDDASVYAFVFTDGAGNRVPARFGLTNASAITDGTLFGGGTQQFGNAFDTAMRITTTAPIPEPSSSILVLLAGVGFLRRRR